MMPASENGADFLLPGAASGLELEYPARVVPFASWLGHTPFALWLIGALKPRMVVELGVHTGNSYCAFLQAVDVLGLETRCFGIDHWQGDAHAGHYGDEVYYALQAYHDPRYGKFSTLLRTSFEGALPYFSDGSVDLLHIDGFHTYEAVSADFESWRPKMSSRGVALFHDINVRERGFGIWQLWEELTSRHPHFEFLHSHGLGIVYLGSEPLTGSLKALFAAKTAAEGDRIQNYFARLGISVVERLAVQTLTGEVDTLKGDLAAANGDLAAANGDLAAAKGDLAAVKVDLAAVKGDLAAANSQLTRADGRKAKIAALQAELAAVRSNLNGDNEAKAELAAVRSGLEQANADAQVLKKNLETAALQVQIKTSMAHQRMAVAARLQRELLAANIDKRSYERQVHEILQSRSWRLTGPIRRVATELRRLLSHDRQSLGKPKSDIAS